MINRKNFAEAQSRREPGPLCYCGCCRRPLRGLLLGHLGGRRQETIGNVKWDCHVGAEVADNVPWSVSQQCNDSEMWPQCVLRHSWIVWMCLQHYAISAVCLPFGILSAQSTLLSPRLYFFKTLALFCFINFFFILEYSWFAMLFVSGVCLSDSVFIYTHIHTHTPPLFFRFFSHIGSYWILTVVHVYSRSQQWLSYQSLLLILFKMALTLAFFDLFTTLANPALHEDDC